MLRSQQSLELDETQLRVWEGVRDRSLSYCDCPIVAFANDEVIIRAPAPRNLISLFVCLIDFKPLDLIGELLMKQVKPDALQHC